MIRWSVAQFGNTLYFYAAFAEYPPSINSLRDMREGWTLEDANEFCRYLNQREGERSSLGRVLSTRVIKGKLEATVEFTESGWRKFGMLRRVGQELRLLLDARRASRIK